MSRAAATTFSQETTAIAMRASEQEMTGSQIICEELIREGVTLLYGYPGGAIMPFYDALTAYPVLHHVLVRHEQAAAHAADGYARATGRVGVCVATSGPGATNLVTGLATAYMDSVPLVAITGQVARPFIGRDAFQETDILGVTMPITKHNFLVQDVEDLADVIQEAFRIARSGRPGPVLIDIPKDVQFAKTEYHPRTLNLSTSPVKPKSFSEMAFKQAIAEATLMIAEARKPVIMSGHGVILSNASAELQAFVEKSGMPLISTLLGLSAVPMNHPQMLGMPGMHGPAHVNRAIGEADLIVGVGLRFDDRVTGNVSRFAPNARLIHIDIDGSEIDKVKIADVALISDARTALVALGEQMALADHSDWLREIRSWETKQQQRLGQLSKSAEHPQPAQILEAISQATADEAMVVSDVGQNQMWTARFYPWSRTNSQITSGGLGTMGFALPAAIGVKMGMPEAPVWAIAGDGGIQMNIQELATLRQEGIEIKVAILNNGYLGMVRQWQQFFHGGNYSETPITGPDYELLAAAYGLKARRISRADEVEDAVNWAMQTPGTVILEFLIESESNVYPMVAPGAGITEMIQETDAKEPDHD